MYSKSSAVKEMARLRDPMRGLTPCRVTLTVVLRMSVTPQQLAATLRARYEAEEQAYARRAAVLEEQVSAWATAATASGQLSKAWLFGSLAKGNWGAGSDVDLIVEGMASDRETQAWIELEDRLQCSVDCSESKSALSALPSGCDARGGCSREPREPQGERRPRSAAGRVARRSPSDGSSRRRACIEQ
jgi:predicted nucleotidyltransferase